MHCTRTVLLLGTLCLTAHATAIMERPPIDVWSNVASPWFTCLREELQLDRMTLFPGIDKPQVRHMLTAGVRAGTEGEGFSRLYLADQIGEEHGAGLWLGDIDYRSELLSDRWSEDRFTRFSAESGASSWAVQAWYVPHRNRVVKGFSLRATDRRGREYRVWDDSLQDVGWEQAVEAADSTVGLLGATLLLAGPRSGFVRVAVDLHGQFAQQTAWFTPALSDSAEWYTGGKHNSIRLDISCAYVRTNPAKQRSVLMNAGIVSGGMRRFSRTSDTLEWRVGSGPERAVDSLGGFLEGVLSRQFGSERWRLCAAAAALAGTTYDYDTQAAHDSWIAQLRTDRRTDRITVAAPLLATVHLGRGVHLFCSWKPSLSYSRCRANSAVSTTAAAESSRLMLAEGALGIHWAPAERFRIAVVPSLHDGVLLSSAEVSLRW